MPLPHDVLLNLSESFVDAIIKLLLHFILLSHFVLRRLELKSIETWFQNISRLLLKPLYDLIFEIFIECRSVLFFWSNIIPVIMRIIICFGLNQTLSCKTCGFRVRLPKNILRLHLRDIPLVARHVKSSVPIRNCLVLVQSFLRISVLWLVSRVSKSGVFRSRIILRIVLMIYYVIICCILSCIRLHG